MARSKRATLRVGDVCDALERIAPLDAAAAWDNVGLLAGDRRAAARSIQLCIDLMPDVVSEACAGGVDMVVAYHPPIFKPLSRIVAPTGRMEEGVLRCLRQGIAVYSPHTALDVAEGGTNDVLAALAGVTATSPLERTTREANLSKVVVRIPTRDVERVIHAVAPAGARLMRQSGNGDEALVELECANRQLAAALDALHDAHPHDEPTYHIYPLREVPRLGIGRVGDLQQPVGALELARKLKRRTGARCVSVIGDPEQPRHRAIVVVGAAGALPFATEVGPREVIVTGEIRHHDALRIERAGAAAVALSHWSSERPALDALATRLAAALPELTVRISEADREPFQRV